ncbi:MAG: heat-inducible transcriptional repressor HrcA [Peptococcaceae bacterium]
MKLEARKQQVLLAIISNYINTAEPVSSRTVAKKYGLGVSPATIRNEMADLEEMGYIEQPHTSAGRIPSELGFRYYVDYLMKKQELDRTEKELIKREFQEKIADLSQIMQKTSQLLTKLTQYVAMVLIPQLKIGNYKYFQLVKMNFGQAMLVVVWDTGIVQHHLIEISDNIMALDLKIISDVFNAKLSGHTVNDIKLTIVKEIYFELAKYKIVLDQALELIINNLPSDRKNKLYLGGAFSVLNQPEFCHNIERVRVFLNLLEKEYLLYDLLAGGLRQKGVTVHIGGEINCNEMRDCSLVISSYQWGEQSAGTVGVLGPMRMDYAKVIGVVEYVAQSLSRTLEKMFKAEKFLR